MLLRVILLSVVAFLYSTALATASSDVPAVGDTISTSSGQWSGTPTGYAYQWQACDSGGINCVNAGGEPNTNQSYTIANADCGDTLRSKVTASYSSGGPYVVQSPPSNVVSGGCGTVPSNIAEPVVTGTVQTGSALTTTDGTWTGSPSSYAYQWQDCSTDGTSCSNITSGSSCSATPYTCIASYTVQSGDAGHAIEAVVRAHNASGDTTANAPIVPLIDNFSGASIDTNMWRVLNQQGDTSNAEPVCYEPRQITVASGLADERLDYQSVAFACPGQVGGGGTPSNGACTGVCASVQTGAVAAHYPSGSMQEISTAFTYGTIKVYAKMSGPANTAWPVIWLLGAACRDPTYLTPPGYGCPWSSDASSAAEIDIAEASSGSTTGMHEALWNTGGQVALSGASCNGQYPTLTDYMLNYHQYELDWAAGSLTWKIDGVTKCSTTTSVPSHPMFLIINNGVCYTGQPVCGAVPPNGNFPTDMLVDYAYVSH